MNCPLCKDINLDLEVLATGRTAYPGCVEGYARVVENLSQLNQLHAGEILVTPMTNPESTPYILKAAAVVTDRGGILCHAAIVCRELKVPCIVGTKSITKRIITGDFICVCATSGKVSISQPSKDVAVNNIIR